MQAYSKLSRCLDSSDLRRALRLDDKARRLDNLKSLTCGWRSDRSCKAWGNFVPLKGVTPRNKSWT